MILLKSVYGITDYGKVFADDLTEWLLESGLIQYQCQMSICYNSSPDGKILFLKSYVDDCVYQYTYKDLRNWFVDNLVDIFYVNFLGYSHWFMSIDISHLRYHSISVDKTRYATSIVSKYFNTNTKKTCTEFYNTTIRSDMTFTKADASNSY